MSLCTFNSSSLCFTLEFNKIWLCKIACVLTIPAERGNLSPKQGGEKKPRRRQ